MPRRRNRKPKTSLFTVFFVTASVVTACAVGSEDELTAPAQVQEVPPDMKGGSAGTGKFDPGMGGPVNGSGANGASYGSGASNGTGNNGQGTAGQGNNGQGGQQTMPDGGMPDVIEEPKPPECTDDLKRCEHEFTYPVGSESKVVLRGDFAADGWTVGVPLSKAGSSWKASVNVPFNKPVQYKFVIDDTTWVNDPNNTATVDDGNGGKNSLLAATKCDFWSCDSPPLTGTFDWRDAVLYFVFVDRFLDGDPSNNGAPTPMTEKAADYQGGDWKGLRQKLDEGYFSDLGVNALWLTVPMDNTSESGIGDDNVHYFSAYHGYWPTNLDKTEEHFGSKEDLKALVDAAHAKGIKVILDYAMNHVHKSSPVYAQHADWFWPLNDDKVQNCVCGAGCSWEDAYQAKRCWFRDYLPDFNFNNAEARKFSVDNAIAWVKDTGVDGFRLDAVKHIEDSWLLDLRARVTSDIESVTKEHFYMVGETFTGNADLIKYYVDPQKMLDGQFDFPLRMTMAEVLLMRKSNMQALEGFLAQNDSRYGAGIMSTFIGNHDIPRPIHLAEDTPMWDNQWADGKDRAWGNLPGQPGGKSAYERLANAFTLLFTTKGVPLIYYGDEVGMAGAGDPDNRRMMQWSGYNEGQLFLQSHMKKLTKIRADHAALRRGNRTPLGASNDVLAYKMSGNGDTVYVVINRGDGEGQADGLPASTHDLLSDADVSGPTVKVPARSSLVLIEK